MDNLSADEYWKHVWAMAVLKAWQDDNFKNALMANAHDALKTAFNYDLPKGIRLRVVDSNQPNEFMLTLPPKPPSEDTATVLFEYMSNRTNGFIPC